MYIKEFDTWNRVKKRINQEERKINIRAGEVQWTTFGVNLGSEIDGKGASFIRPALILNVSGSHIAFVIPLSTKVKDVSGYKPFEWKGKTTAICIHQARSVSQKRILHRLGRISGSKLKKYKEQLKQFLAL